MRIEIIELGICVRNKLDEPDDIKSLTGFKRDAVRWMVGIIPLSHFGGFTRDLYVNVRNVRCLGFCPLVAYGDGGAAAAEFG